MGCHVFIGWKDCILQPTLRSQTHQYYGDGSKLFFRARYSLNGNSGRDSDIWVMNKTSNGWSKPIHIDAPLNTGIWCL